MRNQSLAQAVVLMDAIDRTGQCGLSQKAVASYLAEGRGANYKSAEGARQAAYRAFRALEGTGLYETFGKPMRVRRILRIRSVA